jgi:MFS family permease
MNTPLGHRQIFFGWRVVWAAFTVAVFGWGVGFYGPSVFLSVLHQTRGWPISVISAAISCHFLVSAGIISRLPALYERIGLVSATRTGALALPLGILAWAVATQPWQLFLAALLSGSGWGVTSGAAITAMVSPWFERRRPTALSVTFNGANIGGAILIPLWAILIAQIGMVAAALLVGSIMGVTLWWVAGRFLGRTPASMGLAADGVVFGRPERMASVVRSCAPLPVGRGIWSDRRFATLSLAFLLALFAEVGLLAHLFSLLVPALGNTGAGAALSLVTICAVAGRTLFMGVLPANADRRTAAAVNFAVQIAGSVAFLAARGSSVPLLIAGCFLFGLGVGNLTSLPPLIAQAEFAAEDVPRVVALVVAINQATFAFAPAVLGAIRDATSGTWAPILVVTLLEFAGGIVVLLGRQRKWTCTSAMAKNHGTCTGLVE